MEGRKVGKFGLVKGGTFANPVAHPHPNYMGVPPDPGTARRQRVWTNTEAVQEKGIDNEISITWQYFFHTKTFSKFRCSHETLAKAQVILIFAA